jgi:hypothetical protein
MRVNGFGLRRGRASTAGVGDEFIGLSGMACWAEACARYGTRVPGYKRDLAGMFQRFFETSAPDSARAAAETRLTDAWISTIIQPLVEATRGGHAGRQNRCALPPSFAAKIDYRTTGSRHSLQSSG